MPVNDNKSRLLTNSDEFRKKLLIRNLYSPEGEYPANLSKTKTDKFIGAVSSILEGLTPFKSFNLKNSVLGRLITTKTPLTEVGLILLSKQLMYNFSSHLAQQTFPVINVNNVFSKDKGGKLITKNIDMRITKRSDVTDFESFIDRIFFRRPPTPHPSSGYPFSKDLKGNAAVLEFLKNTGSGQLEFLNKNLYENDYRPFYIQENAEYYYYKGLFSAYYDENLFGVTEKYSSDLDWDSTSDNKWIDDTIEFRSERDYNSKLIWGAVGITKELNSISEQFRGDYFPEENKVNILVNDDNFHADTGNTFNIKKGLLEYTRKLINDNNGKVIDLTRKAFVKNGKIVGFNGSALWKSNNSDYAKGSGFNDKTGVRQHSVLDQYDRFAKAIRFEGNKLYEGNPDSVIYNSVIPRIHPTLNEQNKIDNRNLMFSIENLAVKVIDAGDYGIIDDEYGTVIPKSEVGEFGGRVMWFPPYDININETAEARFESTVMIGRSEPMYNYQNSERSATINFTLLVDYPPQLREYIGKTKNDVDKQRKIAEFFAFGGNTLKEERLVKPTPPEKKVVVKQKLFEPEINPETFYIYFPNDVPRENVDDVTNVIQKMWSVWTYNIKEGFLSNVVYDSSDYGYNDKIFVANDDMFEIYEISGTPKYRFKAGFDPNSVNQYSDVNRDSKLTETLYKVFSNENNRKLYGVYVYGSASKLYTETIETDIKKGEDYNYKLGKRRADAAIYLVKERLKALFGDKIAEEIEVTYDKKYNGSCGDRFAGEQGKTKKGIPLKETIKERCAVIEIKRTSNILPPKDVSISEEEKLIDEEYKKELEEYYRKLEEFKKSLSKKEYFYNDRSKSSGILRGFQSVSGNYFYPVFHSQTPEEFHRRLTFLQQCTRQGAAIRYQSEVDNNGILRARNTAFGRQPICILRIGDFFYTKIVINSVNISYDETTWDLNPEGFGLQPMIAKVTLQVKIIGGQSLKGPIDVLQNAVSFNYYANSTFTDKDIYELPSRIADADIRYKKGVLANERQTLINNYKSRMSANKKEIEDLGLSERRTIE